MENRRLPRDPELFRENPLNLIRLFHVADSRLDIHPATLRSVTRKLDLINDNLRNDPDANRLFSKSSVRGEIPKARSAG